MTEAEIPPWLKNLPLAPVYRPTETEFADPIAFISRIEREAASFGICKVIPPLPRPSKKFVIANLNRSLSKSSELGATSVSASGPSSETPVFTTRQQELGSRRARPAYPKQVWQSGDLYTLEQFEGKSKAFTRSKLGGFKEVTPLLVESLFWKAVAEKPIYIDYANDVPGSGFAVPEEPFRYISWRRNRKRGLPRGKLNEEKCEFRLMSSNDNGLQQKSLGPGSVVDVNKGTSGWKLSNSRWNLQVIARSPGSLTRFMPDDVPGVTSPMVYIGMLFSWFAWHVEDHELHSMNFLHMGSPKTWYAVPRDHAATLEDIVRVKGYGESVDRLAAFTMLGEKTTLLSPEVLVASGVPCCRLVQHPGEFVVTFPRAYHVGFSHGFNCGEAANFATPEWLKVAKEAAIRRAAMNHLPMLSHQQLLYILTMSFVSRIPRTLISGVRSSRLRDRMKEEREIFVKKAFLNDMMNENYLLCVLLEKESTYAPILWEPGMLPAHCAVSQSYPSISLETQYCYDQHGCCDRNQKKQINTKGESMPQADDFCIPIDEALALMSTRHVTSFIGSYKNPIHTDLASDVEALEIVDDEGDLPVGLNIDSGSLACVSCGTLGYPFMAVMQPSEKASNMIFSLTCEESQKSDKSQHLIPSLFLQDDACNSNQGEKCTAVAKLESPTSQFSPKSSSTLQYSNEHDTSLSIDNCSLLNCFSVDSLNDNGGELTSTNAHTERRKYHFDRATNTLCFNGFRPCDSMKQIGGSWPMKGSKMVKNGLSSTSESFSGDKQTSLNEKVGAPKWDVTNVLLRPRIFCLQHAIEVEELLQNKGGGHMRVICHSDYLKFKAYASSIAEEVGILLHLKDVPLENASQEDLNLINISIDEEEHQEDGKEWTSKLGVNLRYTVKQRKISALTQEKLPSALSGMFSSSSTISVVSSLRWLSRKSRTPAKPVGIIVEKSHISANVFGGVNNRKETDSANVKAIQVYKSRKKKTNDLAFKDHNHPVEEIDSCRQIARVIDRSEYVASVSENADNLFTVPISMMENHEISQISIEKQNSGPLFGSFQLTAKSSIESYEVYDHCFSEFDNKFFVSVPVMYKYNISASNSSELSNVKNNEGECSADSDGGRCKSLELWDDMPIPLFESSEVKLLTGTVIETDSVLKFHDSVDPPCQHPLLLTAGEDERVQENLTTEEQNAEGSPRFSLSAEDHVDFLGYDHEMHIEAPMAELGSAICTVHCEGELCNIASTEDEMQKSENPVGQENVSKGEVGRMHLKSFPSEAADVQLGEAYVVQKFFDSTMDPIATIASGGNDCSRGVFGARDERRAGPMNIKSYVRRKNKRKREVDHQGAEEYIEEEKNRPLQKKAEMHDKDEARQTSIGFVRSPCEGLRSRNRNITPSAWTESKVINRRISKAAGSDGSSVGRIRKGEASGTFECDIEGCPMVFRTRSELQLHKRNRCTYRECRKRFSNHKYAMRHQRVHIDERPLKCPWKGCTISFKWEWARTEHLRLHTGERPYRCKVAGCGRSFRFVSDFSRHRRKTGHFVTANGH